MLWLHCAASVARRRKKMVAGGMRAMSQRMWNIFSGGGCEPCYRILRDSITFCFLCTCVPPLLPPPLAPPAAAHLFPHPSCQPPCKSPPCENEIFSFFSSTSFEPSLLRFLLLPFLFFSLLEERVREWLLRESCTCAVKRRSCSGASVYAVSLFSCTGLCLSIHIASRGVFVYLIADRGRSLLRARHLLFFILLPYMMNKVEFLFIFFYFFLHINKMTLG